MNTKEVLQAAYDLIGDKRRWTQGAFAKNSVGQSVKPRDNAAVCWCASGALEKVGDPQNRAWSALYEACSDRYDHGIISINDVSGYAAIRRMFRKAIKEA